MADHQSPPQLSTAVTPRAMPSAPMMIALAPGVRVDRQRGIVEIDGEVCIEQGLLEQIACTPHTREHEALVAVNARPRDVHAALLLLGLAPGAPGTWTVHDGRLVEHPPSGPPVTVEVRFRAADGTERSEPVTRWVRGVGSGKELEETTWLFAGSVLVPRTRSAITAADAGPPGGEGPSTDRYLADDSGSVIGLVTFGDEVLAFPKVFPDTEAVAPLEWEAWTERLPPVGTKVVLVVGVVGVAK